MPRGGTRQRPAHGETVFERLTPAPSVVDAALASSSSAVYWVEDAGARTPHPALEAHRRADLVVVGGGYAGLWTAVLAKRRDRGRTVVLLEAETLGWAASGRNGGFVSASLTHGEPNGRQRWPDEYDLLTRLGLENLDGLERDVAELGLECEFERPGLIAAAVEPHQVELARQAGPDHFLDQKAVRARINSPIFLAGVHHRHDTALVHPMRLALELGRVASELGVEIHENTSVASLSADRSAVTVHTARGSVVASRVALATNVFPSLVRRTRLMTIPVYDYVLMTEPLTAEQRASIGWQGREGLDDMGNQFHYSRLTADGRILYGGFDAIYHYGRRVRASYEQREESYRRVASHFLTTFPQLEGVRFSHRWAGAIDTSTQFCAFHGLAYGGRVAYTAGFTGLGVGATRFAADVMLDRLAGIESERTSLSMVRRKPLPFPPEPVASVGVRMFTWSLARADHREGRRNAFLRTMDRLGLGFDS